MKQYLNAEIEIKVDVAVDGGVVREVRVNGHPVIATIYDSDVEGCEDNELEANFIDGQLSYVYTV